LCGSAYSNQAVVWRGEWGGPRHSCVRCKSTCLKGKGLFLRTGVNILALCYPSNLLFEYSTSTLATACWARVDLEPDYHQNQWGLCDVLFSNYFEDLLTFILQLRFRPRLMPTAFTTCSCCSRHVDKSFLKSFGKSASLTSRQGMHSSTACASCAISTADKSSYSSVGTLHPYHISPLTHRSLTVTFTITLTLLTILIPLQLPASILQA